MAGLFVRKHAEAVSQYADVCVLYLHLDDKIDDFQIVEQSYNDVREIVVYIPMKNSRLSLAFNFLKGFRLGYRSVRAHFGQPDICQVNTLTRNGVLALLLKMLHRIPYVVVEHWTRYLPDNFLYTGFLRRRATELVARNAAVIMPVSSMLRQAMIKQGINGRYRVISNIVDDFFYTTARAERDNDKKRILHVSCFLDRQKNISGILRAVELLCRTRRDFELVVVGTGVDFASIKDFAKTLDIPEGTLVFTGEQTPNEVAEWLSKSDLFVMFSNYETACVVVMESLAVGVPVVATPTGIVPDFINDNNRQIVDFKDVDALAEKMNMMLDHLDRYDSSSIRAVAEVFRSRYVGQQFINEYDKALGRD